ncbi:MAG: hypothetical protein C1O27_000559 [Chloroflexi bacterium]|jgi:hypothetical protein|nr:MAG: hypothetical protein C1O27_000559 [Chloroflexota bacterium]
MNYTRIYTDEAGETHFEDLPIDLIPRDFAPPAGLINVSDPIPAAHLVFFMVPPGWVGNWHPAPRRQYYAHLAGTLDVSVSDGSVRRVQPGDIALLEDVTGKGHETRTASDTEAQGIFIQLPD